MFRFSLTILIGLITLSAFSETPKSSKQPYQKQTTSSKENETVLISTQPKSTNNVNAAEKGVSVSGPNLDEEKAEVLIDWGMLPNTSASSDIQDEDGIPYYLGLFKGVFNMDGKSLLVFEGDDGTISFVQIFKEGKNIRWRIYFQIKRI